MGAIDGSQTVPPPVTVSVQICTTGPRLGLNTPENDGCATMGGKKKKLVFPRPWAPSRMSAEMRGDSGDVTDCCSRQPKAMARARQGATARFILTPPGCLAGKVARTMPLGG